MSLFSRYIILVMSTPYAHILWRSFFRKLLTQYQGAGRKAYIHRSDSTVYESAQRARHMPVMKTYRTSKDVEMSQNCSVAFEF
jgi:hypothetical protein